MLSEVSGKPLKRQWTYKKTILKTLTLASKQKRKGQSHIIFFHISQMKFQGGIIFRIGLCQHRCISTMIKAEGDVRKF